MEEYVNGMQSADNESSLRAGRISRQRSVVRNAGAPARSMTVTKTIAAPAEKRSIRAGGSPRR